MPVSSWLKRFYLSRFSKPVEYRLLYRIAQRQKVRRLVELGVGTGDRAIGLLKIAQHFHPPEEIRYTGIDLFEARETPLQEGSLKQVHRRLGALSRTIQLVPGQPDVALARVANSLANTDLLIISDFQNDESLRHAWFYIPRMLHAKSAVLVRAVRNGTVGYHQLPGEEVDRLAEQGTPLTRKAA